MNSENNAVKVPKRVLNTLLSSLEAGVVPRVGAPYIAIGRQDEIGALLDGLDDVKEGGATCKFLIGRYGSGKSFLIQLVRGYALERGFLCADADLSPERRLTGSGGLATYRELMRNLSSRAYPDGSALSGVLSRYFSSILQELAVEGLMTDPKKYQPELKRRVLAMLSELESEVGGYDFARVLFEYIEASLREDNQGRNACLRWLRGEYANKTEASASLGFKIGSIIDDDNWYQYIKLFSSLAVKIGYSGLVVYIDECVNLYKIPNRISREANYEKLLAIFNDTLQGKVKNLAVVFGGTPQFLEDTRRGLFSYDALKSRLEDSRYTELGYRNLASPVIRLRRLSDNELLALVRRLSRLHAQRAGREEPFVTDEQAKLFITRALDRAGASEMITPREIIRDFLTVLNILRDNEGASFEEVLGKREFLRAEEPKPEEQKPTSEKRRVDIFDIDI